MDTKKQLREFGALAKSQYHTAYLYTEDLTTFLLIEGGGKYCHIFIKDGQWIVVVQHDNSEHYDKVGIFKEMPDFNDVKGIMKEGKNVRSIGLFCAKPDYVKL